MLEISKKILIFLIISGLCVSAFLVRFNNFKKSIAIKTVDEVVYLRMALQMQDNVFAYNSAAFGLENVMAKNGHHPDYFFKPVFKHPPFFTLLIMASLNIFGPGALGIGLVPIFFGVLAIVLVYLLGERIGGRVVGLLAAGFMWIDPVGIMTSQKVWPDAPLMFFMLLTVYGYWKALKDKQDIFFYLGALGVGGAFMIKYPGLLTFFGVVIFILGCYPKTLRNKHFLLSFLVSLVMSLPWFLWNFYVYGFGMFDQILGVHGFSNIFSIRFLFLIVVLLGIFSLISKALHRPDELMTRFSWSFSSPLAKLLKRIGFLGVLVFLGFYVGRSLNFNEVPMVTWRQGAFSGQPNWFYFQRLLRYSFLYGFAYLAFFDPSGKPDNGRFLMKINAFLIMIFFIIWGNFQCRYILPALPFLMILASDYLWRSFNAFKMLDVMLLRVSLQAFLIILVGLAISKTMLINNAVSFTNDMCYF